MPSSRTGTTRLLPVFLAAGLGALAVVAYYPAIDISFFGVDDGQYVFDNQKVLAGMSWEGIRWAFSLSPDSYWHPLTWLSLMLDAQMYGSSPWGYHFTNVLLHTCNVILAFSLLWLATGRAWASAAVAAMFAVHPIHVESVAWVTARKDVLSIFFFFIAAIGYVSWVKTRKPSRRLFSYAAFVLAVLAKPVALTLPFALLLFDYWPLQRVAWGRPREIIPLVTEKIPYFLVVIFTLTMVLLSHSVTGTSGDNDNFPLLLRLANMPVAYATYLKKLLWPNDLAMFYTFPTSIPAWKWLGALGLLAGLTAVLFLLGMAHPALPVGWLFFLGTMFPMVGLVQAGLWPALADRYAYLPFLGLYLGIACGLSDLLAPRIPRPLQAVGLAAALIALVPLTRSQAALWGDSEALLRQAAAHVPDNTIAYLFLGKLFTLQNQMDEAEQAYRKALSLNPQYEAIYYGLGEVLEKQGRVEEGLELFREAVRRYPNHPTSYINLGWALERSGIYSQEAFQALGKAREMAPNWLQSYRVLGNIYRKQKKYAAARKEFLAALERNPECPLCHLGLGQVAMENGQFPEALQEFQAELPLSPKNYDLHAAMGATLIQLQRLNDALPHLYKAVQLQPNSAEAWNNLGVLLAKMGIYDRAKQALNKSLAINPGFERARASLEKIEREQQLLTLPASPPSVQ